MFFYIGLWFCSLSTAYATILQYASVDDTFMMSKVSPETNFWLSQNCGRNKFESLEPTFKISGGTQAEFSQFPWAVRFGGIVDLASREGLLCSGTLISDRHVLSSAHCFLKQEKQANASCPYISKRPYPDALNMEVSYAVVCGHHCMWDDRGLTVGIRRIQLDPRYAARQCAMEYDFAIVELAQPVKFDDRVQPICLPSLETTMQSYDQLIQYGYGKDDVSEKAPYPLRWMDAMIHKKSLWQMICTKAAIPNPDPKIQRGICGGDSGGGLQACDPNGRTVLLGVTALNVASDTCGKDNVLACSVRVTDYRQMICESTGVCPLR